MASASDLVAYGRDHVAPSKTNAGRTESRMKTALRQLDEHCQEFRELNRYAYGFERQNDSKERLRTLEDLTEKLVAEAKDHPQRSAYVLRCVEKAYDHAYEDCQRKNVGMAVMSAFSFGLATPLVLRLYRNTRISEDLLPIYRKAIDALQITSDRYELGF